MAERGHAEGATGRGQRPAQQAGRQDRQGRSPVRWALTAIGLLALVALIAGMIGYYTCKNQKPAAPPPPLAFDDAAHQAALDKLVVGKREGFIHPVTRQLLAEPERFGYKECCLDKAAPDYQQQKAAAIKAWADERAYQIAVAAGFVDQGSGQEIRIRPANHVAYQMVKDNDGKESVNVFSRNKAGKFDQKPDETINISDGYSFQEKVAGGLWNYEYIHTLSSDDNDSAAADTALDGNPAPDGTTVEPASSVVSDGTPTGAVDPAVVSGNSTMT